MDALGYLFICSLQMISFCNSFAVFRSEFDNNYMLLADNPRKHKHCTSVHPFFSIIWVLYMD